MEDRRKLQKEVRDWPGRINNEDISIEFTYYKARAINLYKKLKDLIPKGEGLDSLPDDKWVTMKGIHEVLGDSFSANEIEDMVNRWVGKDRIKRKRIRGEWRFSQSPWSHFSLP